MTGADFINTVAEQLGILAAGQTLAAEDASIIRRRMTATFARLAREELTAVANPENIPDEQALALADIVALDCVVPFGLSGQIATFDALATQARDSLRMVTSERPHKETLGLVRWWGR